MLISEHKGQHMGSVVTGLKLIVYLGNKLVLRKTAREVTPITTVQTKYTDCVNSNTDRNTI